MPFTKILGQESATNILRNALLNGRLAHAYLFHGPEGIGKRLTALTLVKAMNCQSPPQPGDSCEKCPSCNKINSSNHADVIVLEPEGESIKIDQVRALQKKLRYHPLEGGHRACIVDSVEKLNEAASNALLKILEEPPDGTHLFLITSKPHQLLPTILSRCQWVNFRPLSNENIVKMLQEVHSLEEEKALFYASLAAGSIGKALGLANRVDFQKRLDWLQVFWEVPQKTTEEIFESCEQMAKEEEEVRDLLELWKIWIRDLMVVKVFGEKEGVSFAGKLLNHDLLAQATVQAGKVSQEQLETFFCLISEVQRAIDHNANRQLALETLMLGIKKNAPMAGKGRSWL